MELKNYFQPLYKWWWLLLFATVIATVASFLVTQQQPPVYQSRTTLVSGQAVYETNPTGNDFYLNQQLASFYADLAQREPVRNAAMQALGLSFLPDYAVTVLPDSQLIEIVVSDVDPVRAQAVARELANQLLGQTPLNNQDSARQSFIQDQLSQLEQRIQETQNEITAKQAEMADLFSARQITAAQTEIAALEEKLSSLRSNYANLLSNSDRGAVNTLTIIEQANLPRVPVGPNRFTSVLLSGVIAFALAAAAVYLLEYLDDTVKTSEEITRLLELPVVGYISEMDKDRHQASYVAKQPRSSVAEAFRALRTDLEFSAVDHPLKTILVTSAGVAAGKTTVAVNLAVVMAQSGKKVILVDADMRKPSVHRYLGLSNQKGLSDVFRGNLDIYNASVNWEDGGIFTITSGDLPPNPAELLGSKKMDQIIDALGRVADLVILDGPPFLVTDAAILASKVDGTLLVIRHGYTRKPEALTAVKQLQRSGARVLGVALNRIPRSQEANYGMYRYYHGYYGDENEAQDQPKGKRMGGMLRRKGKAARGLDEKEASA
ncbi:MAG: polysaccharide biosynthesis tyrosine autokinase [Chloroflexi bacterium]|nr:polysaccharide biosynthesis tyrosine autokinase [Chloroflexota bacterium]